MNLLHLSKTVLLIFATFKLNQLANETFPLQYFKLFPSPFKVSYCMFLLTLSEHLWCYSKYETSLYYYNPFDLINQNLHVDPFIANEDSSLKNYVCVFVTSCYFDSHLK